MSDISDVLIFCKILRFLTYLHIWSMKWDVSASDPVTL